MSLADLTGDGVPDVVVGVFGPSARRVLDGAALRALYR
jgi:hypothetical protein